MSGHNTICTATALLETGMVPMTEPETNFTLVRAAAATTTTTSILLVIRMLTEIDRK